MFAKKQINTWILVIIHLFIPALVAYFISKLAGALPATVYFMRLDSMAFLIAFQMIMVIVLLFGTAVGVYLSSLVINGSYLIVDSKSLIMRATIIYTLLLLMSSLFTGSDYGIYVVVVTVIINPFIYYFLSKKLLINSVQSLKT